MTDEKDGASITCFFDEFNKDPVKQALTEEVNRKLCEVLTELAEDIVEAMAEAERQRGAAIAAVTGAEGEDGAHEGGEGVDEVAAMAAYNDALAAIMQEKDVNSKDMCALPDVHPLKELFFSAYDQQMFHDTLQRFIGQVRIRKQGPGEWDAEAAEGECDEDHTQE